MALRWGPEKGHSRNISNVSRSGNGGFISNWAHGSRMLTQVRRTRRQGNAFPRMARPISDSLSFHLAAPIWISSSRSGHRTAVGGAMPFLRELGGPTTG
eukprot:scaffold5680_cov122-Isochrysis_galbana.AAC.9